MKPIYSFLTPFAALISATIFTAGKATAQSVAEIPGSITTPDNVRDADWNTRVQRWRPTLETAEKVRDALDFTRGLSAYDNSFRGASAFAIRKGFLSIGAEDNSIVIFSGLMDAKSLFLTANADTVYYLGVIDLSKGRW